MASPFLQGGDDQGGQLGQSQSGSPFTQDSTFNAPVLPRRTLTQPVQQNLKSPSASLEDLALGRASQLLDAVRDRKVSWQKAQPFLKALSNSDKKTLASVRGDMNDDEKRALGLESSGNGSGFFGKVLGGVEDAVGTVANEAKANLPIVSSMSTAAKIAGLGGHKLGGSPGRALGLAGDTAGNLSGDINTFVKDLPAGLVKTGMAAESDLAYNVTHPHTDLKQEALDKAAGKPVHESQLMKTVVNPTIKQYSDTYGPLFEGHPLKTASNIQKHPLGPMMDALALASAGIGTVGRISKAADAVEASAVTKESDTVYRMGKVDRTNETYQPLGYNMEHYVRPTTQQIKNEPYLNHFSVVIDPKTNKAIFSPVGSSHDEIYDAMTGKAWPKSVDETHHIQATGIFDPRTGKVARININPDDVAPSDIPKIPQMLADVKKQAENTYVTKGQLNGMKKSNDAGTTLIKQDTAKNRYDPTTGEKLPPTWSVINQGQRIAAKFPDKESAIAHAQSLATGGVLRNHIVNEFRPYYEDTLSDAGDVVPGPVKQERIAAGKEVATKGLGAGTKTVPMTPKSQFTVARQAFMQRPQGSLIDAFERARGRSHSNEEESIVSEVVNNILEDPTMNTRAKVGEKLSATLQQVKGDLAQTGRADVGRYKGRMGEQGEFISPAASAAMSALGISAREVSDMVRAGAVFLRPAYIPNNWAGNAFLNTIHQGVYAPLNLSKSLVMDKHIGVRNTRGIDQSMGFNASNVMVSEHGTGYTAALTDPVAKLMGSVADQPFRRAAWLHEARRAGYKSLHDVKQLWDQAYKERERFVNRHAIDSDMEFGEGEKAVWDPKQTPALAEISKISRAAQEEIVKFGKYNDVERSVLRNLIFVYSWMRGAGRYFGRFPFQHPIQAAAYNNIAHVGQNWLNQELGGVPNFLIGAIPVGKDDKGNTRLINPFSVNPLGTGQQLFSAAASVKEIITDPQEFNKYAQTDPASLLNPILQSGLEAYTGGRPMTESLPDTVAALRLKDNLEHPGRGQVYPTSRKEAVGQFVIGSMFPRKTSQAAITRSLERERSDQPQLRIDDEVKTFEKETGATMPQEFIDAYKQDLTKVKQQSDFQHQYAKDHGSQGFTNMPAQNRADAALQYLTKYNIMAPADAINIQDTLANVTDDERMNEIANALWRMTGVGGVKRRWDELVHNARNKSQLTPLRP
jgi:hypothetical protein